jgi:hypothetical protein
MKTLWVLRAAALLATLSLRGIAADESTRATPRHPDANDTYTITAILQLVPPFDPAVMNDDFQDVRIVSRGAAEGVFEITYYPLYRPSPGENPNWREEDAAMTDYLRPTPTENWDDAMRRDLLAELRDAGIEPDRLTDKQLVEQVSRWAMKRARSTSAFAVWTIHFPDGKPAIYAPLRGAFEHERRDPAWTDQQMIEQEVLGRAMFYQKVHGSCTSSAIYLTTILRALGIPTRIVFCIPPFDANDPAQAAMFYGAVHHHGVRETVRTALGGTGGFANHLFNEVYLDHHWVRLNYAHLGQPILDAHYFGLLTHIFTTSDLSQVPLAETWGMRYFNYPAGQPKLTSSNPYRLLAVRDRFGANARVDNPPVAVAELTTVTIVALLRPDSPALPKFVSDGWKPEARRPDFLVAFKEWLPGKSYVQMRTFQQRVSQDFILRAAGHPDLRVHLLDSRWSQGDGSFQAYAAEIVAEDRAKIAPAVAYRIEPLNTSDTYRWQLAADLAPVTPRE